MKKSKNRQKLIKLFALSISLLAIIFGFSYWKNSHHKVVEKTEFLVAHPWRDDVEIKKEYVAQIKASQHIELRSMEKGYLQKIYVDEGQLIKKGQKMFQIMPVLLEAELKKAKAEFRLAKIEYDNTLILHKKNIVSTNELMLTKARLDKADAEMERAQGHFDFSTIKAPFDGIMDRFHVRLGSLVEEGELLTNLSDNRRMWVYFNVSEADYLDYMRDKKNNQNSMVELVLANGQTFSEAGKIDTIEADFDNEIGNVAFRASFMNPNKVLRHGETGTILLPKKYQNALLIPQKATFEILDKKFVYVVDEKGKIRSQQVIIGAEIPHLFVINSGLSESDKVLLEGLGKVHVGDEIEVELQEKEAVIESLKLSTK